MFLLMLKVPCPQGTASCSQYNEGCFLRPPAVPGMERHPQTDGDVSCSFLLSSLFQGQQGDIPFASPRPGDGWGEDSAFWGRGHIPM